MWIWIFYYKNPYNISTPLQGLWREYSIGFKIRLSPSKKICFVCFNQSLLKLIKNTFHLKALFVLKIIEIFVLTFWSCRKSGWIRKIRLFSKVTITKFDKQTITTHISRFKFAKFQRIARKKACRRHKFFAFANHFTKNAKSLKFCESNFFFVFLCLTKLWARTFRSTQI